MRLRASPPYVLIADDDPMVRALLRRWLDVPAKELESLASVVRRPGHFRPQLAILDVHLAAGEVSLPSIPMLRRRWPHCAILVITSSTDPTVVTKALAAGADDFLRKPLCREELMARVDARMRERLRVPTAHEVCYGDVRWNLPGRSLEGPLGVRIRLSPLTSRLLATLLGTRVSVIPRARLKQALWGSEAIAEGRLDRQVAVLRAALRQIGSRLQLRTQYRRGIGFAPKPSRR